MNYKNHIFKIPDTGIFQITLSVDNKIVFSALAELPYRTEDENSVSLGEALEEYMQKSKRRL